MEVNSLYQTVFDAKKYNRPILPVPTSDPVLGKLLERALLPDPAKRPSFEEIRITIAQSFSGK
jgi:hypothetical protein